MPLIDWSKIAALVRHSFCPLLHGHDALIKDFRLMNLKKSSKIHNSISHCWFSSYPSTCHISMTTITNCLCALLLSSRFTVYFLLLLVFSSFLFSHLFPLCFSALVSAGSDGGQSTALSCAIFLLWFFSAAFMAAPCSMFIVSSKLSQIKAAMYLIIG